MKRALDAALIALLGVIPASAYAHGVHGAASSFGAGFAHPFSGLDHAFAMIAIGLYAAQARFAMRWPIAAGVCAALVAGAMFAAVVPAEPLFEVLVTASVCALGLLLLGERVIATGWALACIAVFAFAHGAVHAIEQPVEFSSAGYLGGVLVASVVLQAAGAMVAHLLDHRARLAGVPLAAAGAWILLASLP
jgi:urease accessory protein